MYPAEASGFEPPTSALRTQPGYFREVGPPASQADIQRYRQPVETARARGCSLGLGGEPVSKAERATKAPPLRSLEDNVRSIHVDGFRGDIGAGEVPR